MASSSSQKPRRFIDGAIIVGAGPSGLAVAAGLRDRKTPFIILERNHCIASLWQHKTYDKIKLHLPKKFCQLPFLSFPREFPKYPTKDQFISYMESYAKHFSIEPEFGQTVVHAEFDCTGKVWNVRTKDCVFQSRWLIVATGENAEAVAPEIPGIEKFQGPVIHSSDYKSGSEFANQQVLVIGCGNSGMEVCLDLCRHRANPYMVVRSSVHILPREMLGVSTFEVATALLKWLPLPAVDKFLVTMANLTLGTTAKLGLCRPKTGPLELKKATGRTPVLDFGALKQIKSGKIKVTSGIREITKTGASFVTGQHTEFDSIILATGFKSNVPTWLKGSDLFTEEGMPRCPFPNGWKGGNGLYAVGFTRAGLLGTTSDAGNIARDISDQWKRRINGL